MFYEIRCIAQAVLAYVRPQKPGVRPPGQDRYERGESSPRRDAFGSQDALAPPLWQQTHAGILRAKLQRVRSDEELNLWHQSAFSGRNIS